MVSFDTTKTNSSSYFFRPCDGSMLLDMASDFLRIWRACARHFPRRSMDMALAFCPPTEPFRAARRRAGPCGGHIAHGQALEGSVARYRSCHSVLIANVGGSIRRVCHSNHVLNQTAARPTDF